MDQSSTVTPESLIAAAQPTADRSRKGRGRAKSRRISPYSWLGAGAVGLGVGAALAGAALTGGAGIAAADTGTDTQVSSPAPARAEGRPTASHRTAAVSGPKRTPAAVAGARAASRTAGVQPGEARAASAIRSAQRTASVQPAAAASLQSAANREKTSAPTALASVAAQEVAASARVQAAAVGTPSASAAAVWQPGQVLRAVYGIFVSNGTSGSPNAGLLVGNGYSYTSADTQCSGSFVCDGGRGGLLIGAGGNGYNGGNGGNAGLFFGTAFLPGNGAPGAPGCSGSACNTGSGGNALLIGPGGSGGNGADAGYDSNTGALI